MEIVEKGGWIKKYKWQLQNGHGGVQYSIGNIVSNAVITRYGARWVLQLLGDHILSYISV